MDVPLFQPGVRETPSISPQGEMDPPESNGCLFLSSRQNDFITETAQFFKCFYGSQGLIFENLLLPGRNLPFGTRCHLVSEDKSFANFAYFG